MHELDPLLRPRSVAVVGASPRKDSMGEWALKNLERGGFPGPVYAVNPGHDEVRGLRCYPDLDALPETPDLVIFAVADRRVEAVLDAAIERGVPAAVIMSSLCVDDDDSPPLKERVRDKIARAGMLVCGANGMGFYNVRDHAWACGFDSSDHDAPGCMSLISHSGSGMSGLIDSDQRIRVNVAVSTGNEIGVTMDRYLDFVLELPETRVVGLFVETARDPGGFRAALCKARDRKIPVVALKVGRSKHSAELAVSHSGAIAGDDATYEALFEHYGVTRVRDMDEMATAMILFAYCSPLGPGSLAALHDSGGERQLLIDLAEQEGVPLTELQPDTVAALEAVIDPELPAVNPLDAWSRGGPGYVETMTECLRLLLADPGTAMAGLMHDRAPGGLVYPMYVDYIDGATAAIDKPVALVAARQGTGADPLAVATTERGYPVLDGVIPFLRGVRGLMRYRDYLARNDGAPPQAPAKAVRTWSDRLAGGTAPGEAEALAMLGDFGIGTVGHRTAADEDEVVAAAGELGFPLALKTAAPGIMHKTDAGGVVLGIENEAALRPAYRDLASRLGPRVLLATMAPGGVEMLLGCRRDPQFGPLVILGFGGVLAETLGDVAFALPPFTAEHARRKIADLRLRPLLDGVRRRPPADVDAFCNAAARFSAMVASLSGVIDEIDVNPLIVAGEGCIAVDGLVVPARKVR